MSDFPILEIIPQLKAELSRVSIAIVQAPPGAGKSTVLPIHLLKESWLDGKKIVMLEPRRLAARSVAHRIAMLLNESVGETAGYRIRFETKVTSRTRIEIVTEGILTRMMQTDNSLEDVGLVIFDEFHERNLQADLALALCLQAQKILRSDLRILIMSATLDGVALSSVLDNAPVISTTGRHYPVQIAYYPFDRNTSLTVHMARAVKKALSETKGDILTFLPGAGEIARTQTLLESENIGAKIVTLYGDLPIKKQQEAIVPNTDGTRKVVLATSIAETSLTIEGITVVIDGGYSRIPRFDPRSGLTRLETARVTRDAAEQRSGRAGRLSPGICYRLWSEGSHASLVERRSPEILDADLAPLMLELSQWGVSKVSELTWITAPPPGAVSQAKELLEQLEAVVDGKITDRGRKMLKLPTHPRIAHMLLSVAPQTSDLSLATDVAALLEEKDPLPKEAGADLSLRLELVRKWRGGEKVIAEKISLERIGKLAESWRKIFSLECDNSVVADGDVGKLLAAAYPERIARQIDRNSERYKLASGRVVRLPPHDPLMREPWLAVAHLDAGSSEGKIFLAAPVDEKELYEMAHVQQTVRWDTDRGLIVGSTEKRIGNLVLESRPWTSFSLEKKVAVLCQAIGDEGLKLLGWSDSEQEWQSRVMSLRKWREEEWPDVSDKALLASVSDWLAPYLSDVSRRTELQKLDIHTILRGVLPWNLSAKLDVLAPVKLEVPSGSWIKLGYNTHGESPVMEVRLQELFGLLETPTVNEGRTRVMMHLLSPGYKPVQVTQDLRSFWQTAYHEVRKELRRRYPRHSWPEDPLTAKAVRGVKKITNR